MVAESIQRISHPGISVVWLEKYAVYRQTAAGSAQSLDYMLLTEVIPYSVQDVYRVRGFRGAEAEPFVEFGPGDTLSYVNEWLLDRKALSHDSAEALDAAFPNIVYRFEIDDAKGRHEVRLSPGGGDGLTQYPNAPTVRILQGGVPTSRVDHRRDAVIEWSPFSFNQQGRSADALFGENTIFVIIDNWRGETVFSSGSGQKSESLPSSATHLVIPAHALEPGLTYTAFVSFINTRSTDTADTAKGAIAAVAVNSIAMECEFETDGEPRDSRNRPPQELRANYRWPGKLRSAGGLVPWPVDRSGLRIALPDHIRSGTGR